MNMFKQKLVCLAQAWLTVFFLFFVTKSLCVNLQLICMYSIYSSNYTGELGYGGPLYDGFLSMTDYMLGPSPMHIKYVSYVYHYNRFCI